MKKIFSIIYIIFAMTSLVSCEDESSGVSYADMRQKFYNTYHNGVLIDDVGIKVHKFKYENHDYLLFMAPSKGGDCVIHNPNCESCLLIFD